MKNKNQRRGFLQKIATAASAFVAAPVALYSQKIQQAMENSSGENSPIKSVKPLGFQWETLDPFLFCVHHEDFFPKGNEQLGPDAGYLKGRQMGDDFIIKDGFRMYHGKVVPGFPGHPHRGFETVTVVRKGFVDHADSMGAAGRYGNGDVQWMTAGKGVQHSEMFPLLNKDKENTMELFQIWLNLPKKNKMVQPYFSMFWKESIPVFKHKDASGLLTEVEIVAGRIENMKAPAPPPDSWAADKNNDVAIWNIKMKAGAKWQLPVAQNGINRMMYFYEGEGLRIAGTEIPAYNGVELNAEVSVLLEAKTDTSILLLQGRPIKEPVIQYGPFVMNTKEEINQAFEDYHRTKFGGWPWPRYDQVHDAQKGRFAKHASGKLETKES